MSLLYVQVLHAVLQHMPSKAAVAISTAMNWFFTTGNLGGTSTTFTGKRHTSLLHALLRRLPGEAAVISFTMDFEAALRVAPLLHKETTFVHLQITLVSERRH